MSNLLTIRNLAVNFAGLPAVDRINLDVKPGEVVGVVGESGSGKSVTMMALMGLIDAPGKVTADEVTFDGKDLLKASASARRCLQQILAVERDFVGGDLARRVDEAHQRHHRHALARSRFTNDTDHFAGLHVQVD